MAVSFNIQPQRRDTADTEMIIIIIVIIILIMIIIMDLYIVYICQWGHPF